MSGSAINFGTGFTRGFQVVDQANARERQLDQAQDRIDLQESAIEQRGAIADERTALMRENAANTETHRQAIRENSNQQTAAAVSNAALNYKKFENEERAAKLAALRERAQSEFVRVIEGGEALDTALLQELEGEGLRHLTIPYWVDDRNLQGNLALRDVLEQVGHGDFSKINTPETLSMIEAVYGDQLNTGVGELSSTAQKPIMRKSLSGLRAAPNGQGVVALVNVTYRDGTQDEKPVTLNRSSDPNDPVAISDLGEMLDDVAGRVQIAELMSQPEIQERVRAGNRQLFGTGEDAQKPTKEIQNIEYLIRGGMSRDEATGLVMYAKANPGSEIGRIFDSLQRNNFGRKAVPPEELMGKAVQLWGTMRETVDGAGSGATQGTGPAQGDDFSASQIERVMRANPDYDQEKAVRYLQYLKSTGQI